MHRHHGVVLVGTSVGLPPGLQKPIRQLQLAGARQADCLSSIKDSTCQIHCHVSQ